MFYARTDFADIILDTLWESRRRHYGLDEGYQQQQQHQVWLVTKIQKVCDL